MKPLFSDNHTNCKNITQINGEEIISKHNEVAEIMNNLFSNAVSKLDIKGYKTGLSNIGPDKICNAMIKFMDHPSILKIKQSVQIMRNLHSLCLT